MAGRDGRDPVSRPQPFARFGFARFDERELPEAVRRMAAALR